MLRIDETSGTLVAPQASGLVQESPPDREELLGLVTASWDAFAGELGLSGVRLLAREPVPYVDLLGLDEEANRVVVILVTGDTVEWQLGRALGAAADVASWDRERLLSVNTELETIDGTQSPALVLVAGGYDPRALVAPGLRLAVPEPNAAALETLRDLGCTPGDDVVRMRRGAPLAWRPDELWGVFSLFFG